MWNLAIMMMWFLKGYIQLLSISDTIVIERMPLVEMMPERVNKGNGWSFDLWEGLGEWKNSETHVWMLEPWENV